VVEAPVNYGSIITGGGDAAGSDFGKEIYQIKVEWRGYKFCCMDCIFMDSESSPTPALPKCANLLE
jgi:hypothetical protein